MLAEVARHLVSTPIMSGIEPPKTGSFLTGTDAMRRSSTVMQCNLGKLNSPEIFCAATEKGASRGPLGSQLAHSALCKPPRNVQFWLGKATRASTSLLARRTRSLAKIVFSGSTRVSFY